MISNQHIAIRHHTDKSDGPPLTMLTWPAGAGLPRVGESLCWGNHGGGRAVGRVTTVFHEHVLKSKTSGESDMGSTKTAEVNVTIWVAVL